MKKIGILTHYYHSENIGGLLQSYALPTMLTQYNYSAEQICFDFKSYCKPKRNLQSLRRITFKKVIDFFLSCVDNTEIIIQEYLLTKQINTQKILLTEFEKFIPHSEQKYNSVNVEQLNKNYETFVMGSDQVFISIFFPLKAYFGEFATPDKKVISYAASSDVKQFNPTDEKLLAEKLQRFDAISVREKTLKDYIERVTNRKVTVTLDPTFLLSHQEWLKVANFKVLPKQPYVFCYFLGKRSSWQRKAAQAYADKYGYELVHLPYIMKNIRLADRFLKGQGLYDVGPREFISLINGAQCVFTDSFHGMAFSINFGKNFYVFDRDDMSGTNSMNARITDTLNTFNLISRHITDKNIVLDNAPIDFVEAHKILMQKKEESIKWLLSALED